jgi:hypothetical protein
MKRKMIAAVGAALLLASASGAQAAPWQFRWQQGQDLTYRVEHVTVAAETVNNSKSESKTKLNLTKRWHVGDVDAFGVATLELSILAMRYETTTPAGKVLVFDSSTPEKSDAEIKEALEKFVGKSLAVLRVDGYGRVVAVKESKHGPASRFEVEPPFVVHLPGEAPSVGASWERTYKLTLEPPQGVGEKYDAVQGYICKSVGEGKATITLTTVVKGMPENLLDRVPLLPMQPEGEVLFDTQAGRLQKATLRITKELAGYQGEGSNYRFESTYKEEFVEAK